MNNNIEKILNEYFLHREDGGAFFDITSYDDLYDFESFLKEHGYINQIDREKLNELFGLSKIKSTSFSLLKRLWNKVADIIRLGYKQIVHKFKSIVSGFESIIGNKNLDEKFYVTIPPIDEPNIREFERTIQELDDIKDDISDKEEDEKTIDEVSTAGTTAIKGYYNEALTAFYIVQKNKTPVKVRLISESKLLKEDANEDEMVVVQLENEKGPEIVNIYEMVELRDNQLKKLAGDKYEEVKKQIEIASRDMADYLINTVGTSGGIILEVYLTGKTESGKSKADIKLKIKKGVTESFRAWSLKMYQDKTVGLLNTTLESVVSNICGKEFLPKLEELKKSNKQYSLYKSIRILTNRVKDNYKNKKINAETVVEKLTKEVLPLAFQAEEVFDQSTRSIRKPKDIVVLAIDNIKKNLNNSELVESSLRSVRDIIGNGANKYIAQFMAEIMEYCLNSGPANKEIFIKNLLDKLGFSDKDTEFLMALVSEEKIRKGKSELITKHPELNLNDLGVEYKKGSVLVYLVNKKQPSPRNKILTFRAKEAGKVTAAVKYE